MQKYTSAKTSLNQVAGIFALLRKKNVWKAGLINLDIGGGKYDLGTNYLKNFKVENLVYDPFNRTEKHNEKILLQLKDKKADTSTISNVLNVIKEEEERLKILNLAKKYSLITYITVYEGKKNGIGLETIKGYQLNRKLDKYLIEVEKIFQNAEKRYGYIKAW